MNTAIIEAILAIFAIIERKNLTDGMDEATLRDYNESRTRLRRELVNSITNPKNEDPS